jgi:hypothetical protein
LAYFEAGIGLVEGIGLAVEIGLVEGIGLAGLGFEARVEEGIDQGVHSVAVEYPLQFVARLQEECSNYHPWMCLVVVG